MKTATAELGNWFVVASWLKKGKEKKNRNRKSRAAVATAAVKASLGRLPEEYSRKTALGEQSLL